MTSEHSCLKFAAQHRSPVPFVPSPSRAGGSIDRQTPSFLWRCKAAIPDVAAEHITAYIRGTHPAVRHGIRMGVKYSHFAQLTDTKAVKGVT